MPSIVMRDWAGLELVKSSHIGWRNSSTSKPSLGTSPLLSIIIVNWNTCDLLARCLESLSTRVIAANGDLKLYVAGRLSAEVFVVDNASDDGSVQMMRERFSWVHRIENRENVGFARANNQAILMSRGRYVLLLNPDTEVQPGALEAMVQFMDLHPRVSIVGPKLLNEDGTLQRSWAAFPALWSELLGRNVRTRRTYYSSEENSAFEVDWVGGACLMIRNSVIEQVGLLDEAFFMYSEEADFCFRARRAGWVVCYYPQASVIHLGGQSSRQASVAMKAQLYCSKLTFFYKHYGPRRALSLGALLLMSLAVKVVVEYSIRLLHLDRQRGSRYSYQDSMVVWRDIRRHLEKLQAQEW